VKKLILTIYLLLIGFAIFAQVPAQEKEALLDLYTATQGENWNQSWELNTPVADWAGVTVENNHVTEIRMLFNNLDGTLPASIANLDELKVLELSFNKIKGTLPSTLGTLNKLELIAFNGNHLTGTIPSSLENLKSLKELHLSSNQLSGTITEGITSLKHLEVFNVFDNNLSGMIPQGLASMRSLKEVVIAENDFTNTEAISVILLSNSNLLDLKNTSITPSAKSIIAIETEDEN